MGLVCVDKSFRKQDIFRGFYNFMQLELNTNFNLLITGVDSENIRSLNAHKTIGFKELKKYVFNNQEWVILSWGW